MSFPLTLHLVFLYIISHWTFSCPVCLDQLAKELQEFICVCPPRMGLQCMLLCPDFMGDGDLMRVLITTSSVLTDPFPEPQKAFWFGFSKTVLRLGEDKWGMTGSESVCLTTKQSFVKWCLWGKAQQSWTRNTQETSWPRVLPWETIVWLQ